MEGPFYSLSGLCVCFEITCSNLVDNVFLPEKKICIIAYTYFCSPACSRRILFHKIQSRSSVPLQFTISKEKGTILQQVIRNGKHIFSTERSCEVLLTNEDGTVYRTGLCKPDLVEAEEYGPVRAVIRKRGKFLNREGRGLLDNKIQYNLRVTAFAGKPWIKLTFTLENNGFYGFKGELRKKIPRHILRIYEFR